MNTTVLGNTIIHHLNEYDSILSLIEYFRKNNLFDKAIAPCDRCREKYEYQIPQSQWIKSTGIEIDMHSHFIYSDGAIWLDRFFDADYKDYDDARRYVYISLDEPHMRETLLNNRV
jgi:hypothetical protein